MSSRRKKQVTTRLRYTVALDLTATRTNKTAIADAIRRGVSAEFSELQLLSEPRVQLIGSEVITTYKDG